MMYKRFFFGGLLLVSGLLFLQHEATKVGLYSACLQSAKVVDLDRKAKYSNSAWTRQRYAQKAQQVRQQCKEEQKLYVDVY